MKPTSEQLATIEEYAAKHGRNWKGHLRLSWMTGRYEHDDRVDVLHTIRNTFGPTWLVNFRLNGGKKK